MEPLPRCNTLASSVQIRQTSLFQSLSSFLDPAQVESFIRATKTGAKKSKVFIAVLLIIRNKDVLNCALYQVKQIDHGKIPFQVKTKYDLAKLRLVNGVSEEEEETELELVFEKGSNLMSPLTVKWSAESGRAKKNFLVSLWKLVNEHMTTTPQFLNINYNMLQDSLSLSKTLKQVSMLGSPALETKEYKYLTGEEERDLGVVTEGIDWAVENAEDFMEKLMNELSGLTKANIHSIMAVENDVIRLFNIMDHALHELCRLEDIMVRYEDELNEDLLKMEETLQSYKQQQIRNDNTRKLHDLLTDLLDQISFSETTSDMLLSVPLKTASQITRVSEAVYELQDKRKKCTESPLIHMTCVAEQRDKMDNLLQAFGERVVEAVSSITSPSWNAGQTIRHSKLLPLLPVVNWLASYNKPKYEDLAAQYQVTAQTAYQKVLREFFEDKRSTVTRKSTEKLLSKFGSRKSELALSQKMLGSTSQLHSQTSLASGHSTTSLDSLQSSKSETDFTISHGSVFEASIRDSLDFVEITMSKEESFIGSFFKQTRSRKERADMGEVVLCRFTAELESFINTSCKFDPYYALPIYLSILDRLDDTQQESFLFKVLRQCLDTANIYFNKMHKMQKERILENNKKARRGTASCVLQFTQFLLYAESLQKNGRRSSLEMCYTQLADAVCQSIEVFATVQSKMPSEVATIENYHFIYHFLFRNKIDGLEKFRSHCHKKYKDSLEQYVKSYLGTPLDKINVFFEGVKLKLNSGVPHQEIGFYSEFSKQKLKALIADYTVKEVKKGLESVMKKIEKHFTKEQNLFTVACLTMQAEFIKQVEGYENLMKLCYPDAGLKFSFTIAQIHAIFDGKSPRH